MFIKAQKMCKRCTCCCVAEKALWVACISFTLVFLLLIGFVGWLQTPPAHRMAAAMIFDTESFDDPDRDTMHWRELSGIFPLEFHVYDVRWLRAQGQCTDNMNVTVIGGEKRCVSVFAPVIKAKLDPWKILTEGRLVANELKIPYLVLNSDAMTPTAVTTEETPPPRRDDMRIFADNQQQQVGQTQATPPWFKLYGTTKFDAFNIAHLRIVDSVTIAGLMGEMHRVHRTIPSLPLPGDRLFDDVTLYGKSTIIGHGGSWDLSAHIRSLQPAENRQHLDIKFIGNSIRQDVTFDATFRTTSIDGMTVEGSSNGRGTWRALNMLLEPFEALGYNYDGERPLEINWDISTTGSVQVRNKLKASIDAHRTVFIDSFESESSHGTVVLDGTLGGADAYETWPQLMRAKISNATVPFYGQNRTLNAFEAACDRFACQVSVVADNGANTAAFDLVPQQRGVEVTPKDIESWKIGSSSGQCRGFCDDTVFVFQPFECHEGQPDTFATLATNLFASTLNETWCVHAHNNYGHVDVVVNATSKTIDKLEADLDVQDVEEPLFSIGSLSIDAKNTEFMVDANGIAVLGISHAEHVSLKGEIGDLEHASWTLLAQNVVYGSYRPLVVMAHGTAVFEDSEATIVSNFGHVSTDVAHIEWGEQGLMVQYDRKTLDAVFRLDSAFGRDTPTGHLLIDVDATLGSFMAVGLTDFNHYAIDIQDDASTLFALVPKRIAAHFPNGTSVVGTMRIKAWGDNGELPKATITLTDGTVVVPAFARVYETTGKIEIPNGDYEITGKYQSATAQAEFESIGWFAWRRGAARFTSDTYYVSDTGTETEFSGELVWKPGKKVFPSL